MRAFGIALILLGALVVLGLPGLIAWLRWQYTVGVSSNPYRLAAIMGLGAGAIVAGAWLLRRAGGPRRPRSR